MKLNNEDYINNNDDVGNATIFVENFKNNWQ